MKEFIKKAAAFVAAAMMVVTISSGAFAATSAPATSRPRPGSSTSTSDSSNSSRDNSSSNDDDRSSNSSSDNNDRNSNSSSDDDDKSSTSDNSNTRRAATQAPSVPQAATQAPAAAPVNKSYTTKGGAFLWFLLSVIVNTIISFSIANRFYKISKKSNHVQAEIRALRRDVEEKFADSVGGFTEPAVDITNTNDDYSAGADGIKMTPASSISTDDGPEDVYKEWEAQFAAKRAERRAVLKARPVDVDAEYDDDDDDKEYTVKPSNKKYQPVRKSKEHMSMKERLSARNSNDDDDDDDDISSRISGVGNKAKKILGGLFPFDNDEDDE